MDQGKVIKVKITVDKKNARGDRRLYRHLAATAPTNFNAPEPVTRAAVLYVFRVMVDDDIPMNAGCLRPINIVIPDDRCFRPQFPRAVVAGNVEISQAVTDTASSARSAHLPRRRAP